MKFKYILVKTTLNIFNVDVILIKICSFSLKWLKTSLTALLIKRTLEKMNEFTVYIKWCWKSLVKIIVNALSKLTTNVNSLAPSVNSCLKRIIKSRYCVFICFLYHLRFQLWNLYILWQMPAAAHKNILFTKSITAFEVVSKINNKGLLRKLIFVFCYFRKMKRILVSDYSVKNNITFFYYPLFETNNSMTVPLNPNFKLKTSNLARL